MLNVQYYEQKKGVDIGYHNRNLSHPNYSNSKNGFQKI